MRDVTHAARRLIRTPGHSAAIVLTLALGIGATTTIYSIVSGVLLRPLPFPDQDRLVMLWQRAPGVGVEEDWFSPAQYFDIREQVSSFEEVAVFGGAGSTLTGKDGKAERIGMLLASSSLFRVLGVKPAQGRLFIPEDDVPGTDQRVVLSHRMFTQRYGGDPAIVGSTIVVNGFALEVVGVLADLELDGELFPTLRKVPSFDLVISWPIEDPQVTAYGSENYNVLGRLRPEATLDKLEAELLAVAESFTEDPESLAAGLAPGAEYRIGAVPLLDQVVGNARRSLLILLGATGLLLAIACVNVANLLLARAATESRQHAIRVALGASRRRILVQSMTESLMLALAGGAAGVVIASVGVEALQTIAPTELPRLGDVSVDPSVLLLAAVLCLGSSLFFGVGPALRNSKAAPVDVLAESGGPVLPARSVWRRGGSGSLVVLQVALSVMLLIGAGLLVRSFQQLQAVDPGFRAEGVLSFRLGLVGEKYADPKARVLLLDQLWEELRGISGVVDAGGVTVLPMTGLYDWTDFAVEGYEAAGDRDRIVADEQFVTPGYFETMEDTLLAGRLFNDKDDDDPRVAIVNRSFAESFWSVDEAIGKWVIGYPIGEKATIVGVVDDMRHYGLAAEPRIGVFYPYRSRPVGMMYGTLRADVDPKLLIPQVARLVEKLDPSVPIYDVRPLSALVDDSLSRERLLAYLLNVFGIIALILATIGLYGVLSFAVATHTYELGIRMALGARRQDVHRFVLGRARILTFIGIGLGAAGAIAVESIFEGLVYGVSTTDPLSFAAAILLVATVALGASYIPARRAARVDPMTALKEY